MKNILLLSCILLAFSNWSFGQTYSEMVQKQKEIFADKTEFILNMKQSIYVDGVIDKDQSYSTTIMGKNGRSFWESSKMKVVQNEKAYLMIREEDELILYSTFARELDTEARMAAGIANWDLATEEYLKQATSVEKEVDAGDPVFVIKSDNPLALETRVRFNASSGLVSSMEVIQQENSGPKKRLVYQMEYDFETAVSSKKFDEARYVTTTSSTPKGKGKYAEYQVVHVPVD